MVFNGHDVIINCDLGLNATGDGKRTCENGKFPVPDEPIKCEKSLKQFYYVVAVKNAQK